MKLRRVVVTGLGALTPIGNSLPEYWEALQAGVSGAADITHFDAAKFKTRFACEVKNFDPSTKFDRKEARKYDLFSMYALVAADEAIKDSGIDAEGIDKERVGVVWASGIGGLETFQREVADFYKGDGTPRYSPFFIPRMIADIASGHISILHGFGGPNFTTIAACASSTVSVIQAFNLIRLGKANAIVSGGSEASIFEAGVGGFSVMQAISSRNDDPKTASRPFDLDRDGFVIGEGAGAIILEELEHALARGAKIYAEMAGGGESADAYHMTAPHPEGRGASNVMKWALEDAEMQPTDIDYINVHGTATPLGDIAEPKAIINIFGDHAYKLSISSTKSMTGHLLGAAGAVEAIASVLAVHHDVIPPTINHFTDDPEIDNNLDFTFNVAKKRTVNAALSNTFGFGGHNASVIFKKYNP
ncbi:MAG: beta-ketoacyl-ACP synthase II [Bacteroidetes bacterium]|nr:beta-ketoacyl-ACP synthase II [Bacteroidota bacterium]MBU1717482.1 beta-ketoacyl-ACP synthase II [Bacteroidota bacterium]